MRTLERITVTGYKSIRELRDFELGDINVLIGANGAGKSNFLSVFNLLRHLVKNGLQLLVGGEGVDYLLHFGVKTTDQIEIQLQIKQQYVYKYDAVLGFAKPDRLIFNREKHTFNSRDSWEDLGVGHAESKLPDNLNFGQIRLVLEDLSVYHFQDTTAKAPLRARHPDIAPDNSQLKSDANNLAALLYNLRHNDLYRSTYDQIVRTIRLAAPFFDDFVLRPTDSHRIPLRWKHRSSIDDFDTRYLSDGTLRFICLTTLLLHPMPPKVIIIDEPELGLHPYAMGLLVEMLRSVATKSQVIISTQSPAMVSQFFPEEVIVVDQEKDASVFRRLNSEDLKVWLEDYSLGEIWEMNLVGGRPRR